MKRVRTGIVGYGKVAHTHALALSTVPESKFAAVCGRSLSRAQAFGSDYGIEAFGSVRSMIDRAGIQAVIVCTPHPAHAGAAVEATEAGAHVLVEKPRAAQDRGEVRPRDASSARRLPSKDC